MHYNPVFGNVTAEGKIIFYDKSKLAAEFNQLKGKEFVLKVVERDDKRTLPQNKYLHACIKTICDFTGDAVDVMKAFLTWKFSETVVGRLKSGEEFEYKPTTSQMKKKPMSAFIENIRVWAPEKAKVYLPTAEEWKAGYHDLDDNV